VRTEDERRMLESWVKHRSTAAPHRSTAAPHRSTAAPQHRAGGLALRARIVLACAQGGSKRAVAARLGVARGTCFPG
jgi:hypothetical protein